MRRRKFSREFKIEAVKLVRERGVSVAQAGRDLDVHENVLRNGSRSSGSDPAQAFPGHGQMKPEQQEIERLRREVTKLKAERDILKTYGPPRCKWFLRVRHDRSASTYPASDQARPRWRYARSGPHKLRGVGRHFLNQVSRTPFDCQAISLPPLANIVSSSAPQVRRSAND